MVDGGEVEVLLHLDNVVGEILRLDIVHEGVCLGEAQMGLLSILILEHVVVKSREWKMKV